jgi:ferredoxin
VAGLGADVYCCGPPGLIAAVEQLCRDRPSGALHVERFAASTPVGGARGPISAPAGGARRAIEVVCARSGIRLDVPPGRSILEMAEEAGLDPESSCAEGICGTCETTVLEGEPEHLDDLLTEDERASGRTMMICVSRARTSFLVLDM